VSGTSGPSAVGRRLRTVVVDDESWARQRLVSLLRSAPDVDVVAECENGRDAIERIIELEPDLVLLDVQMPEIDGFDVVAALGPERMPSVVFATAFEEYAVRAFEAEAIDYLLKPFDEERLLRALARVRAQDGRGRGAEVERRLRRLVEGLPDGRRYLRRLVVRTGERILFLRVAEVDWLEAQDNYVAVHAGAAIHLLRVTLNGLESRLDPADFVRVHRSTIVNLDRVRELSPWARGDLALVLKDGTRLTVGRAYRARLAGLLSNTLPS
jgi:two-component system LytT family response regulator